ncbi:MAG: selenocysteine-specific translation elongation factor [Clostridium sp.]|nr:selenocysteine-specific translation elongation factor [Clostridium sp.]
MKNVVMGTAGHIDHGKTALVKRLTGVDTDRLEEEKRRGMTIELGFASLTLPSGNVISVIDVPGHEKFVKTLVAGVTGIDFVMLVIAADEGVMPQTKEHIDILSLLNVKSGVIVLTKTDLVDDEWLQMVKDDVKNSLKGTTLEDYPMIPVSSVTGEGIQGLVEYLEKLTEKAANSNAEELFRLSIDRVFTITGHGTIITGTVAGGEIKKGDMIEILPKGLSARIRGIQVHNHNVETASAGDRCALNIAGVEKAEIERGNLAANPGIIKPTRIVDAVLHTVKDMKGIAHNQRVHVHVGTKEVLARIRVLGEDEILGESKGYVQLRFEEPIAVIRGDRFIIRSYSPVVTLGGGKIIFHSSKNRQRFSEKTIETLKIGEAGNVDELVDFILRDSGKLLSIEDLWKETFINKNEIRNILQELMNLEKVVYLPETDKYISRHLYREYMKKINMEFETLYEKYPFRFQIDKEEIKSKVFSTLDVKEFAELLNSYIKNNLLKLDGNFIVEAHRDMIDRISERSQTKLVEKTFMENGLNVKSIQQLKENTDVKPYKFEDIEKFLIQSGKIIDLGSGILIHVDVLKHNVKKLREIFDKEGTISVVQARDYLETSRKFAVALLEYLDSLEVTIRYEDIRKPGVHYMDYFR